MVICMTLLLLLPFGNGASESAIVRKSPPTHCIDLIATVAAMLLSFCLVTGRNQKAFQLPLNTWPVC